MVIERYLPIDIEVQKISSYAQMERADESRSDYELFFIRHTQHSLPVREDIVTPRDFCVVFSGIQAPPELPFTDDNAIYRIRFPEMAVDSDFLDAMYRLFAMPLLVIPEREWKHIELLMNKLYLEEQKKEYAYKNVMLHQLNELLMMLYRLAVKGDDFKNLSLAEQAIVYLDTNLFVGNKVDLSLEAVASHFHMSGSAFSRMFKKGAGIGFKQYILTAKLTQAKRLLATTDYSVTEVAFRSGFSDSNYFSSVFRKFESVTPTEYARMIRS